MDFPERKYRDPKVNKERQAKREAARERRERKRERETAPLLSCDICGKEQDRMSVIHVGKTFRLCSIHLDGAIGVMNQYVEDEKNAGV